MQNKVRELREKQKLSQYQLAELSGLSRSQIIKVEKMDLEQSDIRLKTLLDIARGLNVDLLDVIGIEPKDIEKRINRFNKKKITMLKNVAKAMQIKVKIEDE